MAGFWNRRGILLLIFTYAVVVVENSKLNVPRVLLPVFNSFRLKFVLEGTENECYEWSTSRSEIVLLQPIYEDVHRGCASKVVVSANTKDLGRNTAIVFAEEQRSGIILRCDVITDVIHSLSVITTTRELFIEEAPEAFEVRAYDIQGNEFSSLEGVEFKWTLSSWNSEGDDVKETNVIRFMTFNESPYETPSTVQDLDSRGLRGHIVLLEGLKTGTAKVTVELPYPEYSEVNSFVVNLSVMCNLIISPADVYIMPGQTVQYSVLQVQNGRLKEMQLLSHQYFWEIEDPKIAIMDDKTSMATGLSMGRTRVLLHDRNMDESDKISRVPSANIGVSEAAYLTLTILPHHNWAVVVGERYEIIVDIYDKDDHKLQVGDVKITTTVPSEYFLVEKVSENGTYIYGQPVTVGSAQVRSTLLSIKDQNGRSHPVSPKISVQANLMIYKPISVQPAYVVLPWETVSRPRYETVLNVTGGDGSFIWNSSNRTVATVSRTGVVTTFVDGKTEIYAAMTSNPQNKGVSRFHILPPKVLEIVDYMQETEIGHEIFLHVALFTKRQLIDKRKTSQDIIPFTQCNQVPFTVRVWDDIFVYNSSLHTKPSGVACTTVGVKAAELGTSKVTVSYELASGALSDHVTIASFKPLSVLFPASGELVLAVGCSADVIFTGGPLPWGGKTSEHTQHINSGGQFSIVSVTDVNSSSVDKQDRYIYNVLCKQLGETDVTLTVGNRPLMKQSKHSESSATVRIICAKPRIMMLHPELNVSSKPSCPANVSPERVVVQFHRNIKLGVTVKDAYGRLFYNFTSLQFDWSLSDEKLATVVKPEFIQVSVEENKIPPNLHFHQTLKPYGKAGILEVKARIVGYHSHILRNLDIVPEYPPFALLDEKGYDATPDISAVTGLILVNDACISPNSSLMFNHPNNVLVMNVNEGSGFYELIISTEDIADVSHREGSKVIEIRPRTEGFLKLTIVDLCLPSEPAVAEVQVVSIGSIQVEAPERVEKGRSVPGVVRMYDSLEKLLPIPRPDLLDLRPHIEEDIVSVMLQFDKDTSGKQSSPGEVHFVLTGLELGEKLLSFSAGPPSREVHSEPIPIQVFPPLRLLPHNVTLVVGSVFQISSRGGPLPDANIEFSLSGSVASVDKKGLVEGLSIGNCMLIGRAVGVHRRTGQRIVYSQDSIEVHVVPLTGIKIQTPITRIVNHGKMPVWANGIPDQITPLILGSCTLPIKYNWHISSREVGELYNVYHTVGLSMSETDLITVQFQALRPGRVTISVNVIVPGQMTTRQKESEVEFSASLEIEIFEELRLIEPPTAGEIQSPMILMTPNSVTHLKTNHEGNVHYTVLDKLSHVSQNHSEELSRQLSEGSAIITVEPSGLIKSYSSHGRVVVQITVNEDFGLMQILYVLVEVKPIRYMLVSLRTDFVIKENEVATALPRGAEIPLSISYHDNAGRTFDAFDSDIKLRMNRFDLTKVQRGQQKNTITASVLNSGATMLKLWDDVTFQHVAEYTRLKTNEGILPSISTLSVGDVICFYVPFIPKEEGIHGIWTSDIGGVLELNTALGIGRARAAGTVVVKHHFSSWVYTSKEIKVLPLAKVKVLPLKEYHITNSGPETVFRVPIALKSESETLKTSNLLNHDGKCHPGYSVSTYPYLCSLHFTNAPDFDVDDIFAVTQEFNLDTGQYSCDIVASGDSSPLLSTLDTNITVNVACGELEVGSVQLRFLPAVYVSTPELHLSDAQMSGTLIVSGLREVLEQVEIIPGNSLISVSKSNDQVVENAFVYSIVLSNRYWTVGELSTSLNVSVVSDLTRQVIQVPLKVHLVGEKTQMRSPCLVSHVTTWSGFFIDMIFTYRHTLLISATLLLVVVATVYGISSFTPVRRDGVYVSTNSPYNRRQSVYAPYTEGQSIYGEPKRFNTSSQDMRRPNFFTPESRTSIVTPDVRRLSATVPRPRRSSAFVM